MPLVAYRLDLKSHILIFIETGKVGLARSKSRSNVTEYVGMSICCVLNVVYHGVLVFWSCQQARLTCSLLVKK